MLLAAASVLPGALGRDRLLRPGPRRGGRGCARDRAAAGPGRSGARPSSRCSSSRSRDRRRRSCCGRRWGLARDLLVAAARLVWRRRCCSAASSTSEWFPMDAAPALAVGLSRRCGSPATDRARRRRPGACPARAPPRDLARRRSQPLGADRARRSASVRRARRRSRSALASARARAPALRNGGRRAAAAAGDQGCPRDARRRGAGTLRIAARQRIGSAEYIGHDSRDGRPLRVRQLGRDAQDTQRLARRWRRTRPTVIRPGASPSAASSRSSTRRGRSMLAAQAGVRVPRGGGRRPGRVGDAADRDAPTEPRAARARRLTV